MRIILVGQGPFGEKVLEALIKRGEEIVGVFSPPDKRGEAMKKLAERSIVSSYCPKRMKDPEVYETFKTLSPDLVILAFVTDILPEELLSVPSIGTICYHPSLLPRHRGASGINWAIIHGDTRTGVTILWADKGIDTGPILLQKEVEISPDDTTGSLYFNTLFPMGIDAIIEAVELIKKGKAPRIPQDESKATYELPCDDRVASIDFEKSVHDIYNLIRGCDPQPGAYTTFKGKKVRFYDARMETSDSWKKPGEVLRIETDHVTLAVKGGVLRIGKFRVDKGDKIGPAEFARSLDAKVGDRFGG
jgi:methionyl-tRNA formyltransferase